MEQSRFGAFMIQCNKCSRGKSLDEEDFKREIIICSDPECRSEFSIYEGVKNGLKKVDDHITPNNFLANYMINEFIDVKVGYVKPVELPNEIKKIYKIILIPTGNYLAGAVDITNNRFNLFTSLVDDGDTSLIGTDSKVIAMINYKVEDYQVAWLHMLQYAFDQLRSEEYLTSILLSEIAFETYIDTTLTYGYSEIGLDNDSISRLLEAAKMHDKVNPLMYNFFGIKLASSQVWGKWQRKVLEWRNDIAHGTKVNATKEEAVLAYETVVDAIFHFIEGVDNYLKGKGIKQGMFYRL